ncbi:hypothetical protein [Kribbella soli]|nr:hypothetical protein [Kribbella soli]
MSDQGAILDEARRGLDLLDRALTDIESGGFDDEKPAGHAGW